MPKAIKVEGQCHCGAVKYTAVVNPMDVRLCHCNDCQILSGSAFRISLPVAEENYHQIQGELKTYIKVAESGNKRAQCFCPECGTQIYATSVGESEAKVLNLRVGNINQRQSLPPHAEKFLTEKLSWVECLNKQ